MSPTIREMQIKTIRRYHLTSIKKPTLQKAKRNKGQAVLASRASGEVGTVLWSIGESHDAMQRLEERAE
jgi:hypothetical protein